MMPRHFTEEIDRRQGPENTADMASMMPRHFTEEIRQRGACRQKHHQASMMPRHFTEEICRERGAGGADIPGFNDASAFHRGNPSQTAGTRNAVTELQ